METPNPLHDLVQEVRRLAIESADPQRRTLSLSPEVAEMIQGIEAPPLKDEKVAQLRAVQLEVRSCVKCPLHATRTQTVFGTGNPNAQVMFIGEAPGADEDRQGEPFVGAAGQLLTQIIEKGMKLKRSDVYICNVLKCRPPNNRDPRADEVAQCEPYLFRQVDMIRPKVICALGAHAAHTLLRTSDSTSRLRGKWHFFRNIPLRVTYHPAYVLRCQDDEKRFKSEKLKVWDDIQAILRVLDGTEQPLSEPSTGNLLV